MTKVLLSVDNLSMIKACALLGPHTSTEEEPRFLSEGVLSCSTADIPQESLRFLLNAVLQFICPL